MFMKQGRLTGLGFQQEHFGSCVCDFATRTLLYSWLWPVTTRNTHSDQCLQAAELYWAAELGSGTEECGRRHSWGWRQQGTDPELEGGRWNRDLSPLALPPHSQTPAEWTCLALKEIHITLLWTHPEWTSINAIVISSSTVWWIVDMLILHWIKYATLL